MKINGQEKIHKKLEIGNGELDAGEVTNHEEIPTLKLNYLTT